MKSPYPVLLIATLVVGTLAGCDRLQGSHSSAPAQQAAVSPPAPPAAAPAATTAPASTPAPAPAPAPAPSAAAAPAADTPAAPPPPVAGDTGPSLEVRSHIKQGFAYIASAKNAPNRANFDENLENAINEFGQAIRKDPKYAEAYSNRAVAYMQQKKFNKAYEDLRRALELNPNSASINYNMASLYSLRGDVDLALDSIDAALQRGFGDYDALRKDPDLENVRKHPEFRKVLEKHKVFIMR